MTSQDLANVLLREWQKLWPLPAQERMKQIDRIVEDLRYEDKLQLVANEMGAAA